MQTYNVVTVADLHTIEKLNILFGQGLHSPSTLLVLLHFFITVKNDFSLVLYHAFIADVQLFRLSIESDLPPQPP